MRGYGGQPGEPAAAEAAEGFGAESRRGVLGGAGGRQQRVRMERDHYRAAGDAVRGRVLQRHHEFSAGLPQQPAVRAVHVGDVAPECVPGRAGVHLDPARAGRRP